jgi:hypothetical protein
MQVRGITANDSSSNSARGIFSEAQPMYAAHGIATFPLGSDKMPEVANFQRMGLPASTKLATRFAGSPALGFMCGRRNGVTVLDVDTTNERVLTDADSADRSHGKRQVSCLLQVQRRAPPHSSVARSGIDY